MLLPGLLAHVKDRLKSVLFFNQWNFVGRIWFMTSNTKLTKSRLSFNIFSKPESCKLRVCFCLGVARASHSEQNTGCCFENSSTRFFDLSNCFVHVLLSNRKDAGDSPWLFWKGFLFLFLFLFLFYFIFFFGTNQIIVL